MKIAIRHLSPCDDKDLKQARQIYDIIKNINYFEMAYNDFEQNYLMNTDLKILTAQCNKKIIGAALYFIHPYLSVQTVYVQWFAVDKDYRRKGIGKEMFENLRRYYIGKKSIAIDFHVRIDNTRAIQFYESIGAVKVVEAHTEMALLA